MGEIAAKEIIPVDIEQELRKSYLDYAMSVIVGRALPDARDGLKPVHRRCLYAMQVLGNEWNKAHKKDDGAPKVAVKCDMCLNIPGGSACVRACPTGAAIRVSPEDFFSLSELSARG